MTHSLTTSATAAARVPEGSRVEAEILNRRDIFEKTQIAEDAVLSPADPGGLSRDLRHALAARIAALHGETGEAVRLARGIADPVLAGLADPAGRSDDPRVASLLAFTDAVSTRPRDMVAGDIEALQASGVSDADIVRLAELNAFLSYQLRLIAGLRLMVEAGA